MSANCPVQPTCPESSRVCSPVCKSGFSCTLNVIDALCQCPVASCTQVNFDTGDSGTSNKTPSSSSIVGPVVGAIAGLAVVAAIVVLVIRRKRKRRIHLQRDSDMDPDDSIESFSKRWTSVRHQQTISHPCFGNTFHCLYMALTLHCFKLNKK